MQRPSSRALQAAASAHAHRVLDGEQPRQARVGIRERDDEEAQARARAAQAEVRLPEVGLRLARGPGEVEVLVALRAVSLARRLRASHRRGLRDVQAAFLDEPLPYAPGGMALLAPFALVVVEPLLDELLAGV